MYIDARSRVYTRSYFKQTFDCSSLLPRPSPKFALPIASSSHAYASTVALLLFSLTAYATSRCHFRGFNMPPRQFAAIYFAHFAARRFSAFSSIYFIFSLIKRSKAATPMFFCVTSSFFILFHDTFRRRMLETLSRGIIK